MAPEVTSGSPCSLDICYFVCPKFMMHYTNHLIYFPAPPFMGANRAFYALFFTHFTTITTSCRKTPELM